MAFGDTSLRQPGVPGHHLPSATGGIVNPDAGITSYRRPDPGAMFPDFINYSPSMIGIDYVSTDNIGLESIIAEHIATVTSTPIEFVVDTIVGPTIQWLDANGVIIGDLRYAPSGGLMLEAKNPNGVRIVGTPVLGSSVSYPRGEMSIYGDNASLMAQSGGVAMSYFNAQGGTDPLLFLYATNAINAASMSLRSLAGSQSLLYLPDSASYFTIGAPGTAAISYIGGNLLFDNPVQSTIAQGGHFLNVGHRDVAAAGGQAFGNGQSWRHLQTNVAGTAYVTPTSFVFSASVATNANTLQIRFPSYQGGMFTCNSIAAGVIEWFGTVTVS